MDFKKIINLDTTVKNITEGLRVPSAHFPSMVLSHKLVVQLQLFIYFKTVYFCLGSIADQHTVLFQVSSEGT